MGSLGPKHHENALTAAKSGGIVNSSQKCKSCKGSGWNFKYNMPCPACSELPTLRELKTPRTQTGKFLRDLSCSDLKCRTA